MELSQLKYFQTVANKGSMTKAAAELHITQPALSKNISRLEDELGIPLFNHRKGKIELNDYGKMFLASVNLAFQNLDSGIVSIRRMYDNDRNLLSLASNITGFLPDILPEFLKSHSGMGIRQMDLNTAQMTEMLLQKSITLGISCEEITNEFIDFEILGQKPYVLLISRENPLASKDTAKLSDLAHETLICDDSRLSKNQVIDIFKKENLAPQVGYEIENTELIYNLVKENSGVAILPLGLCAQIISRHESKQVKLLQLDAEISPAIIGIVSIKECEKSPACLEFIDYIKECLEKEDKLVENMFI